MVRATRRMKTMFRASSESNPLSSLHLLFPIHINTALGYLHYLYIDPARVQDGPSRAESPLTDFRAYLSFHPCQPQSPSKILVLLAFCAQRLRI